MSREISHQLKTSGTFESSTRILFGSSLRADGVEPPLLQKFPTFSLDAETIRDKLTMKSLRPPFFCTHGLCRILAEG